MVMMAYRAHTHGQDHPDGGRDENVAGRGSTLRRDDVNEKPRDVYNRTVYHWLKRGSSDFRRNNCVHGTRLASRWQVHAIAATMH